MTSIARILCPIDFSEESAHAVDHAIAMARWYNASLTGLHVYDPSFVPGPGLEGPEAELKRLEDDTRASFVGAGATGVGLEILVDVGRPAHQILARASAMPADLIVMGTHGTSGFEHLVLGSVTERVLRKAPCPVLTVPPRARATSSLPFKRLVCAVDFSEWSLKAVETTLSLARETRADVTLVHVIEWPWHEPPPPHLSELPRQQAKALADFRQFVEERAVAQLKALMPAATPPHEAVAPRIVHGTPYVEILRVAGESHADLIVMGVHGRNAADLVLFGSTTNQLVRRATCPVLTVRA
jgi:nucleotide-binding universal stress UspA family protein